MQKSPRLFFSKEFKSLIIWVAPLLFLLAVVVIYPLVRTVYLSFTDATLTGGWGSWIGLSNYQSLLKSPYFLTALYNSVIYTGVSVFLHVTVAMVVGVLLAQELRGIHIFRTFILVPYMVPTVVSAFLFKWVFDVSHGAYNLLLVALGVWPNPIPVFGTINTAMAAVILLSFWRYMPFTSILVLARVLAVPKAYYEMATVDGLSSLQTFRYVTFPQLKGVLKTVLFLRAIWMFGMFDLIQLTTGGGPIRVTETLPLLGHRIGFGEFDLGLGSAVYVIMLIILIICFGIYWKYFGGRT